MNAGLPNRVHPTYHSLGMHTRSLPRLILGILALFALGWAQTVGLHRGFMCECGGEERLTQVDHCHGPHSATCHEDEDHDLPCPHHDDEDAGDRHQHAAVVDSLVARQQTEAAPQFAVSFQTAGSLNWVETAPKWYHGGPFTAEAAPRRSWRVQEWPQRLAQSIALRI